MSYHEKLALVSLVGFVIGFAVFVGTLVFAWRNRTDVMAQQATKTGAMTAVAAAVLGLLYSTVLRDEPGPSAGYMLIPLFCMAPAFVIGFYLRFTWQQRVNPSRDRD